MILIANVLSNLIKEDDYMLIWIIVNMWRIIPTWLIAIANKNKDLIKSDLDRWNMYYRRFDNDIIQFGYLLLRIKEYRNLLINRLMCSKPLATMVIFLFSPCDTLFVNTIDIGERFFIHHGFATIINAEKIGNNCRVSQQVTIGQKGDCKPTIGDNVKICAGAIVIGDVKIGNNSIVGAGAVVVKDIPPNEVWGGNPAHFIKKNDN